MRKQIATQQKLCFNCLKTNRQAKKCNSRFTCYKCHEKHNTALCEKNISEKPIHTYYGVKNTETNVTGITNTGGDNVTLLKTAIAYISDVNGMRTGEGRLLFDDASTKSYITRQLCDRLKLRPISKRRVIIRGACATSTVTDCEIVQLKIQTLEPQIQIYVTAGVLEEICQPLDDQLIRLAKSTYPHLEGVCLADLSSDECSKKIDILIGRDFYYEFLTGITKKQSKGRGPVAILTKVGWVLGGPVLRQPTRAHTNVTIAHTLKCTQDVYVKDPLLEQVKQFWSIESVGIRDSEAPDEYHTFTESLIYDETEKRYEVGLPWKGGYYILPDNYSNSERRLYSNIKMMKKDKNLLLQYNEIIQNQLHQGVIEL